MKSDLFNVCKRVENQTLTLNQAKNEVNKIVDQQAFLYTVSDVVDNLKDIYKRLKTQHVSNIIMRYGMEDGVTISKKDNRYWLTDDGFIAVVKKIKQVRG